MTLKEKIQSLIQLANNTTSQADTNLTDAVQHLIDGFGSGSGEQPWLNAPTVSRNGRILTITNPSTNGNFASEYKLYDGSTIIATQTTNTFNLFDMLPVGVHTQVHATMGGLNFHESNSSNNVSYSIYSVTKNLTNISTSDAITVLGQNENYSTTLSVSSGFYLPTTINVTMGGIVPEYTYDYTLGSLTVNNVTGNLIITAVAETTPLLDTPSIAIDTDTLNITDVDNATSYDVYVDGVNTENVPKA